MADVLVVGYGNELRGDDAAGYHVALGLANDARLSGVDVLPRRQLTPELAEDASRARLMVLVDATREAAPGEVSVREVGLVPGPASKWSHHMTPEALLALSAELYGAAPHAHVVSIGVASLGAEERLSPAVAAALPRAADAVAQIVEEHRDA